MPARPKVFHGRRCFFKKVGLFEVGTTDVRRPFRISIIIAWQRCAFLLVGGGAVGTRRKKKGQHAVPVRDRGGVLQRLISCIQSERVGWPTFQDIYKRARGGWGLAGGGSLRPSNQIWTVPANTQAGVILACFESRNAAPCLRARGSRMFSCISSERNSVSLQVLAGNVSLFSCLLSSPNTKPYCKMIHDIASESAPSLHSHIGSSHSTSQEELGLSSLGCALAHPPACRLSLLSLALLFGTCAGCKRKLHQLLRCSLQEVGVYCCMLLLIDQYQSVQCPTERASALLFFSPGFILEVTQMRRCAS